MAKTFWSILTLSFVATLSIFIVGGCDDNAPPSQTTVDKMATACFNGQTLMLITSHVYSYDTSWIYQLDSDGKPIKCKGN